MGIDFCNDTERHNVMQLFGTKRDLDIKPIYTYLCPVIIFICFFSIIFNSILISISRHSKVVNKSPILLLSLNLAVTDLIASLLNGFSILFNSYLPEVYDIKMGQCSMLMFEVVRCAALVASALHLLALAFVHYRGIVNPLHYRSTIFFSQHLSRTINIISIACWIIPLTIMISWFSSSPCQGFQSAECDYLFLLGFTFRYMVLTLFALPLLLMSVIYLRIFIIISRHQKGRRLNHERSTLNRGVLSAAGTIGTPAAVNLPELMIKTEATRCASCAAKVLQDEDEPTISILDEATMEAEEEIVDNEEEIGCVEVPTMQFDSSDNESNCKSILLMKDKSLQDQLESDNKQRVAVGGSKQVSASCYVKRKINRSGQMSLDIKNSKKIPTELKQQQSNLNTLSTATTNSKNNTFNANITSHLAECTCDNKSRQSSKSNINNNTNQRPILLSRSNTVGDSTTTNSKDTSNGTRTSSTTTTTIPIVVSKQQTTPTNMVTVSIASHRSSVSSVVAPQTNSSRSQIRRSPTSNSHSVQADFRSNTCYNTTTSSTYEPQRRHIHASAVPQTNTKALVTTLLILGTYFISYVPAIIYQVLTCVDNCPYPLYDIPFSRRVLLGAMTTLLLIAKSIIDPFIYSYRMSEIQVAISRYISKRRSKSTSSMHTTNLRLNMSLQNNNNNNNQSTNPNCATSSFKILNNANQSNYETPFQTTSSTSKKLNQNQQLEQKFSTPKYTTTNNNSNNKQHDTHNVEVIEDIGRHNEEKEEQIEKGDIKLANTIDGSNGKKISRLKDELAHSICDQANSVNSVSPICNGNDGVQLDSGQKKNSSSAQKFEVKNSIEAQHHNHSLISTSLRNAVC